MPANKLPIMTELAPTVKALVKSPEYLTPPSAMIGMSRLSATRAQAATDDTIGTPIPATTRVVQMDPAPMPTLTASTPRSIRAVVADAVATLPAIKSTSREFTAELFNHVEHALRVAVRGIDNQDVHVRGHQRRHALRCVLADANGGAHAQPAERILAGVGDIDEFLDVFDGDESLEAILRINHEEFFHLVVVEHLAASSRACRPEP